MPDATPVPQDGQNSTEPAPADMARWPLAYKLQLPKHQIQPSLQSFGFDSTRPTKKCWWGHRLYRGPENQPVQILDSKTKDDSEKLARQFLNEPVVGFDMEWPWNDWKRSDLQNKIGLIQVASLDKIALFHIGLHPGKTTQDIIAPSLRKLIEDPKIGKLGVGILSADFARLRRYFRLNPKGAVELSHLYRLIKFGGYKPELVSTKMVSLARLVEDQLGHPLYKGDVRTSNWSKPLSKDQINYAAGDAYAGFMLYHCMNYKRLEMKPTPPLPLHAEKYQEFKLSGVIPLRLDGKTENGTIMTSETFFGVSMTDSAPSRSKTKETKTAVVPRPSAPSLPKELTDATSQALFKELVLCRIRLAEKAGLPVYRITTNNVLVALALQRPSDKDALLAVKGVGAKQQESYGTAWLEVISQFQSGDGSSAANEPANATSSNSVVNITLQPPSTPRRTRRQTQESSDSSPAFATPVQRTPTLHTGLSFTMAETTLEPRDEAMEQDDASSDAESDDSLPSLDFGITPASDEPQLKRKRTASLDPEHALSASQRLQQLTQAQSAPTQVVPTEVTTPKKSVPVTTASLTPRSRIMRNKLSAFSKLVARKLPQRPSHAPPIVSERTLSLIVIRAPQTMEDLERIPGIDGFILGCEQTGMDLLKNILKFSGKA